MKEGKPLADGFWRNRVWQLAFPLILANLTIPLLGAVDTAVIGDLSAAHIGAVAVGSTVFSFLYWGLSFLRLSTTGLAAQAHGAGNIEAALTWLARAVLLAVGFGILILLCQTPIVSLTLTLFNPTSGVQIYVQDYIFLRIWGAPAALANIALLGWFIGLQRVKQALVLQVIINGTNIFLDILLAKLLGMEVRGVALATMISQYVGLGAGLYLVIRLKADLNAHWTPQATLERKPLLALMSLNRDIFLRSLCVIAAVGMFTIQGARMGELVLAANGILIIFQHFLAYGLDGFAQSRAADLSTSDSRAIKHAMPCHAMHAVGARDKTALRSAVKSSTQMALVVSLGYVFIFLFFGDAIISVITDLPDVRLTTQQYFGWVIISPIVSVWAFQLDGIFIGATRARDMRNAMLISFFIYLLLVLYLVPLLGNHGLWLAFTMFMVARGVTLMALYPRLEKTITVNSK